MGCSKERKKKRAPAVSFESDSGSPSPPSEGESVDLKKRKSIQKNPVKDSIGSIKYSVEELKGLLGPKSDAAKAQKISIGELRRLLASGADVAKDLDISTMELKALLTSGVNAVGPPAESKLHRYLWYHRNHLTQLHLERLAPTQDHALRR